MPYHVRMKKFLSLASLLLVLTACGSQTVTFRVQYNTTDPAMRDELAATVLRVIEGRLLGQKKELLGKTVKKEEGDDIITLSVSDADAADMLRTRLTEPFSMEILKKVGAGQGDIISEKYGEFKETGITTRHFSRVIPRPPSDAEATGTVVISFTDEGKALLKNLFAKNKGESIGIFVRGMLMSQKTVEASDSKEESISIDGIPSADLAAAFADDANTGLHVTITAVP